MRIAGVLAACVIALPASASDRSLRPAEGHSAAGVIVLAEPGLPYYMANPAVAPRAVARVLHRAGVRCRLADAGRAARLMADRRAAVLVNVYGATYPQSLGGAIRAFRARGGCVVSAGVPCSHPCRRRRVGRVVAWTDLGYRPAEASHSALGFGSAAWVPADGARVVAAADGPLHLPPLTLSDTRPVPGARVIWYPDPAALPQGDKVVGILGVWWRGRIRGWPVAAVLHRCARFPGAVDFWAGTGLFADPRDPRQATVALRLLAAGGIYCLRAAGAISPRAARAALAALDDAAPLPAAVAKAPGKAAGSSPVPRPATSLTGVDLLVADVRGLPLEDQRALACLEGLANRRRPRVYLVFDDHDEAWLRWYRDCGIVRRVERVRPLALARRVAAVARGAVVADDASLQAAMTWAAVNDAVVATRAFAERIALPVIADFAGRWSTRLAAMRWAFANVWPRCNKRTVYHLSARAAAMPVDYIIANRLFCFWISGPTDGWRREADPIGEVAFAHRLMGAVEPPGCVLGWWGWGDPPQGIGEYWGMSLASRYGLVTVGTEFLSNATVHSALAPPVPYRQRLQPPPALDRSRVYISLNVLDSGNDPWYWRSYQRDVWLRDGWGDVPVGWCLGPLTADLAPALLSWYYQRRLPSHELLCAVSGLGYMHVREFANLRGNARAVWRAYWRLTDQYCRRLDLRCVSVYMGSWGEGTATYRHGRLASASRLCPAAAAWLPDLGRADGIDYTRAVYTLATGRPVFHCLTRWRPWRLGAEIAGRLGREEAEARFVADEIRSQTPARRPAFMNCLLLSWTVTPTVARRVVELLGGDYVAVTPSQLAALYGRWLDARSQRADHR